MGATKGSVAAGVGSEGEWRAEQVEQGDLRAVKLVCMALHTAHGIAHLADPNLYDTKSEP